MHLNRVALLAAAVIVLAQTSPATAKEERASVLIDFGNGHALWADVTLEDNRTAARALEQACTALGLHLEMSWSAYGALVNDIADRDPAYPEYWRFLVWNTTAAAWEYASVGVSSHEMREGEAIALSLDTDDPSWDFTTPWPGPAPAATPLHRTAVAMFRHDLENRGAFDGPAPAYGRLAWRFDTNADGDQGREIGGSPVVLGGRLVVETLFDGLFALWAANGTLAWRNPGVSGLSTPAAYGDDLIVGAKDGRLYRVDGATGATEWSVLLQLNPQITGIVSSPKVHHGRIFVGTFNESGGDGRFAVVRVNGSLERVSFGPSIHMSSPAVRAVIVYFGVAGHYDGSGWDPPYGLTALREDDLGEEWSFSGGSVAASPLIVDVPAGSTTEVRIVFPSRDGNLYALRPNGTVAWSRNVGASTASPAAAGGHLYVGTLEGRLYALDFNGTPVWTFTANGPLQASPAVADGKVFVATNTAEGTLYALRATDGKVLWSDTPQPPNFILSSPVVAEGMVFVASDSGHVLAYAAGTPPPPEGLDAGWVLLLIMLTAGVIAVPATLIQLRRRKPRAPQ